MLLHYYRGHPASVAGAVRSAVVMVLTWVWSARLTHNYLRREGWEFGKREDWRFNEMRGQYGKTWWWMSFFAVYLSQQVMILFCDSVHRICILFQASQTDDYSQKLQCVRTNHRQTDILKHNLFIGIIHPCIVLLSDYLVLNSIEMPVV